jgi:hypothetical protein
MPLTNEITSIHAEMQRRITKKLEEAAERLDKEIGDNPAILKRYSPKCYVISSSELFKHDNWTPQFHDFRAQAKVIINALSCVKPENLQKYFSLIVAKRKLPRSPTIKDAQGNILYDGKYSYSIHPGVIEVLKKEVLDTEQAK